MATAKNAKQTESKNENTALAVQDAAVPAFLAGRTGPARGSETVGMDDLVIPRLELVQALSPCIDEDSGDYIEGAKQGMLYNNVTRELYGNEVKLVRVSFKKEHIVWKNRKKGGGFVGAFDSEAEAESVRKAQENPEDYQVNDTANHFCLMVNPNTGRLEEIVVSMAVTKLKVSRQWNSLIRINGGDSFSRVYVLGSFKDQNGAGETYYNYTIRNSGWVSEEQFLRAESMYNQIQAGGVKINRDTEAGEGDAPSSTEY